MIEYKVKVYDNRSEWRNLDDELHRLDGPAVEYKDGYKGWWINGERHRLDGPAIEWSDGSKEWWVNGKRHRVDGSAIERVDGHKEWWIDGNECTEQEFLIETRPIKELSIAEIEKLLGHKFKIVE